MSLFLLLMQALAAAMPFTILQAIAMLLIESFENNKTQESRFSKEYFTSSVASSKSNISKQRKIQSLNELTKEEIWEINKPLVQERNVTKVYIWFPVTPDAFRKLGESIFKPEKIKYFGHVSIYLPPWRYSSPRYVSFSHGLEKPNWKGGPTDFSIGKTSKYSSYDEECKAKGRQADQVVEIKGLCVESMKRYWQFFEGAIIQHPGEYDEQPTFLERFLDSKYVRWTGQNGHNAIGEILTDSTEKRSNGYAIHNMNCCTAVLLLLKAGLYGFKSYSAIEDAEGDIFTLLSSGHNEFISKIESGQLSWPEVARSHIDDYLDFRQYSNPPKLRTDITQFNQDMTLEQRNDFLYPTPIETYCISKVVSYCLSDYRLSDTLSEKIASNQSVFEDYYADLDEMADNRY